MNKIIQFLLIIFATFGGANVNADTDLTMNIGGDLTVESKQDTDYAKGSNWGINAGIGSSSVSGGFNVGKSNHDSAWVNDMTELTGGNVNISVDGKTTIKGGMVAAVDDDGNDTGNLNLATNELEYENLKDFNISEESGFGVSTSFGKSNDKGEWNAHPSGTTTVSMTDKGNETEQTTHATIGDGTIKVVGNTDTDLVGLNRDVANAQETTKDMITGALDGSVTIDNRILTEEGRAEIIDQHENLSENIEQIGDGLRNNIVVKSVENAITDDTKSIIDTVGDYIEQDRQMTEMQEKQRALVDAVNGLTNLSPEQMEAAAQDIANFVAGMDGFSGDISLANIDGNVIGFAYQSEDGSTKNISLNLANIDMTDPNAVMKAIYHETTNFDAHTRIDSDGNRVGETTAKNRGDTGAGIFDLKNYGNENTNTMDNGQWLSNYDDSDTIQSGNLSLVSDVANNNLGNGTGNACLWDFCILEGMAVAGAIYTTYELSDRGLGLVLNEKNAEGKYTGYFSDSSFTLKEAGTDLAIDAGLTLVGAGAAKAVGAGVKAYKASKAVKAVATKTDDAIKLSTEQSQNLKRFTNKWGSSSNVANPIKVESTTNGGATFTKEVPGKVPGSKAVYQKNVDSAGNTLSTTKTTYDPSGNVVHIKPK